MTSVDDDWRGLWHPESGPSSRRGLVGRLVIYVVTPLALVLLFGAIQSSQQFGSAYLSAFIIGSSIGVTFEVVYRFVWPFLVRGRPRWSLRIAGHVVTTLTCVTLGTLLGLTIGTRSFGWDAQLFRLWLQGLVIASVILSVLVVTDELKGRAAELQRREAAHRVAVLRAELGALQARTDPHFLFNSLNSVAALIPDDPQLAETSLERLAQVFRYALEAGRRQLVDLADELEAVTAYLEVEALRVGERLRYTLERDPSIDPVRVPPLVLQPLVENAIRHGAGGRQGPTELIVSVTRRRDEVVLVVEDRGDQPSPVAGGSGTALADLRSRLALVYGDRARLDVGPRGTGWRAELILPAEVSS